MCFCTSTIVGTKFKVQSKRNKLGFQENNYEHQIPYQYSEIHCRAISTNGLLSLNIRSESPFFLPPVKKGRLGGSGNPVFFFLRSKRAAPGGSGKPVVVFLRSKRAASGGSGNPVFFLPPVKKGGSDSGNPVFFLPPVKKGGSGSTSPHAAIANAIDSETFLC